MNEEKFQDEKRDAELMKKASTEIKISYLKMILLLNELTSSQTIVLLNILFEERKMTKDEFKNLGIGETFQLGYHKLRVEETSSSCKNCYMNEIGSCDEFYDYGLIPECIDRDRKDEKAVIFREIEK